MFNVKQPCADCPFIKDGIMNLSLSEGRMRGIVEDLHRDKTFTCHKTIDYSAQFVEDEEGESHFTPAESNQHCAGALLYMERDGYRNQVMQIGMRLGAYKPKELKGMDKIIDKL